MTNGLIPITDEQAKLSQEIVKAFRDLGSFFGRALGSTPEDLVGYYGGDRLRIRRAENIVKMMYEAQARLAVMGIEETKPATLSIALPILEGAADEDREELVDLWARLLASAMDATKNNVRYSFISSIRKMDPLDAVIVRHIHEKNILFIERGSADPKTNQRTGIEDISIAIGRRSDEVEVSVRHLRDLGFFDGEYYPNALNREFMRACYPEVKTA